MREHKDIDNVAERLREYMGSIPACVDALMLLAELRVRRGAETVSTPGAPLTEKLAELAVEITTQYGPDSCPVLRKLMVIIDNELGSGTLRERVKH